MPAWRTATAVQPAAPSCSEHTPAKQARYRAAVRDVPYPVPAIWAADDPAMTLAVYGEKARAAAGLSRLHTVPGKHFPQEDQALAIAQKIAELALPRPRGQSGNSIGPMSANTSPGPGLPGWVLPPR